LEITIESEPDMESIPSSTLASTDGRVDSQPRLVVWQETMLLGLTRFSVVFQGLNGLWHVYRGAEYGMVWPGVFIVVAALLVGSLGLVRGHYVARARVFIGVYCLVAITLVHALGLAGGFGALVGLIAVMSVLLLGLRDAMIAVAFTLVGLIVWWFGVDLGWWPRPPIVASDSGSPSVAGRVLVTLVTIAPVIVVATSYLVRKLATTLNETEALLVELRKEVDAREREAGRRRIVEQKLFDAQKLEAIGQLAGGVAHDVNNNLTVALASAELILAEKPSVRIAARVNDVRDACMSASALTRQLLAIGRRDASCPEIVAPLEALQRARGAIDMALRKEIALRFEIDRAVSNICVDPRQLQQVLLNLAINARDAMPRGGELTITLDSGGPAPAYDATTSGAAPDRPVRIHVKDTGEGITDHVLARIFEPFFTTKQIGKGTGLGLAMAQAFAEANKGRIGVRTRLGEGATFTLELPGIASSSETARPSVLTAGARNVLVVDDDDRVRAVIAATLRDAGHTVSDFASGDRALAIARDPNAKIDLLCTDIAMPDMPGEELVQRFRECRPETPIVICSGYVRDREMRKWIESGRYPIVHKPFYPAELRTRIDKAFSGPST